MKRIILSVGLIAASSLAAPLAAEEKIKPVQPKVSTQEEVLGGLTVAEGTVFVLLGAGVAGAIISDGGSSNNTVQN